MIAKYRAHDRGLISIAMHPQQPLLASGDVDGNVLLWDVVTWERIKHLRYEKEAIQGLKLKFNSDGSQLAVGIDHSLHYGIVEFWESTNWQIRHSFETAIVNDLAFSRDGKYVAVASNDVSILDGQTGKTILQFRPHESRTSCLRFADDGKRLVTGGDFYYPSIAIWQIGTWELQAREFNGDLMYSNPFDILHISDSTVLFNDLEGIFGWNMSENKLDLVFNPHPFPDTFPVKVAVIGDGNTVVYGTADNRIEVTDLGSRLRNPRYSGERWTRAHRIANAKIMVKDLTSGEIVKVIEGYEDYVTCILFDTPRNQLITCDWEGNIFVDRLENKPNE